MNIADIKNEKVRWILEQVWNIVGKNEFSLMNDAPPHTIVDLRRRLTGAARPKLGMLSEETLQRIGSYGLGMGNNGYWEFGDDDFFEQTQLQNAGLALVAGMSGNEFLREMAFTTIVALTWDILHQSEYRTAEHQRRRSYAIA